MKRKRRKRKIASKLQDASGHIRERLQGAISGDTGIIPTDYEKSPEELEFRKRIQKGK